MPHSVHTSLFTVDGRQMVVINRVTAYRYMVF